MAMSSSSSSSSSSDTTSERSYMKINRFKIAAEPKGSERREHRRYELGGQTLSVNRWDGHRVAQRALRALHTSTNTHPNSPQRTLSAG